MPDLPKAPPAWLLTGIGRIRNALSLLHSVQTGGTLLLMELVLPDGAPPHPGMLLDLEMLVHAGGRERTPIECSDLLSRGGFRLTRAIPSPGLMSIVEAVPA